jgi:hypothetical protein
MKQDINKLWKIELKDSINKELNKMNKPELRKMLIISQKIKKIFLGSK